MGQENSLICIKSQTNCPFSTSTGVTLGSSLARDVGYEHALFLLGRGC